MTAAPPIEPAVPAPGDEERPTWSVMIPVHNCADLLDHTLRAVVKDLSGRSDVEVVVVDDMSTDDPSGVVDRVGSEMVTYVRLTHPHGAAANFNECLRLSRGRFIHILHGDDSIRPGFYSAMEAALGEREVLAAVCRTEYVDADGHPMQTTRSERQGSGEWTNALDVLAVSNRVRPSAIAARRDGYEQIGGFREDLPHTADWEMWTRLAAHGRIWFVDDTFAQYRVHDASDTAGRVRSGDNVRERITAIEIVNAAVPEDRRRAAARRAFGYSALFASRTGLRHLARRDARTAFVQFTQAGRCIWRMLAPGLG